MESESESENQPASRPEERGVDGEDEGGIRVDGEAMRPVGLRDAAREDSNGCGGEGGRAVSAGYPQRGPLAPSPRGGGGERRRAECAFCSASVEVVSLAGIPRQSSPSGYACGRTSCGTTGWNPVDLRMWELDGK